MKDSAGHRAHDALAFLRPDWPAPASVGAAMTLRAGGVSESPYDSLNLGTHVGDDPIAVAENRRRMREALELPSEPVWLEQVHGTAVLDLDADRLVGGGIRAMPARAPQVAADAAPRSADRATSQAEVAAARQADAVVTRSAGRVCVIQVADCMPVLLATREGAAIGAAHAGWRGLAGGVLEATVAATGAAPEHLMAWLGPAIGPAHFEVGDEVRAAFLAHDPHAATAFTANARGRWQCDLYALARRRLAALGVSQIFGGGRCTYAEAECFFSFRRENPCGRMAALIWLQPA